MKIGFDGKRATRNKTGLGNYSRSLIVSLAKEFPEHDYIVYTAGVSDLFNTKHFKNIDVRLPQTTFDKKFPAWWRRRSVVKDIHKDGINIFHGLSNELPTGIEKISTKTVITVHDLIFERYPGTYHFDERYTHRWKMKQSCKIADAVIAASEQTRQDLIHYYRIPAEKIFVCYQHCNAIFENKISDELKAIVKKRYQLPDRYFLFVSSITKRKNLIIICKALKALEHKLKLPLVVIGDGKKEKVIAKEYLRLNRMEESVVFLNEVEVANESGFTNSIDFPAIYQQAVALIYPSCFEGFGIPILEAMWSGLPVISSDASSLPEVAGDAALYFSPDDVDTLASLMWQLSTDTTLAENLKLKGLVRAKNFTSSKHAKQVMDVYLSII
jgi:glycosyltransferase involved in cell wall biosynthesis